MGYDVHRYGSGRPMKLGGIIIPNAPEVIAHSDGDVLLHALMDALLGCAALGDIGRLSLMPTPVSTIFPLLPFWTTCWNASGMPV